MKVNYAKKKRRRWCGCAVPFFVRQVPRRCRRGSWRISRNLENTKKKNRCSNVCRRICFNRRQHWEKEDVQDAGRTHQITDYADDNGALIDSGHHLQRRRETHHYPNSLYARSLFLSLSLSLSLLSCHLASSHNLNGLLISWCSVEFFANVSASIIPSIPCIIRVGEISGYAIIGLQTNKQTVVLLLPKEEGFPGLLCVSWNMLKKVLICRWLVQASDKEDCI